MFFLCSFISCFNNFELLYETEFRKWNKRSRTRAQMVGPLGILKREMKDKIVKSFGVIVGMDVGECNHWEGEWQVRQRRLRLRLRRPERKEEMMTWSEKWPEIGWFAYVCGSSKWKLLFLEVAAHLLGIYGLKSLFVRL